MTKYSVRKFFALILCTFLLSACTTSTSQPDPPVEEPAQEIVPTEMPRATATEPPTVIPVPTDDGGDNAADAPYIGRPPEELWAELACSACHQIDRDQTETDSGPVGPHQGNLAERIPIIAPDQSAEEYVYTSIVDPNAFVVEPYFPNIMPQTYGEQMSEAEIQQLVQWLLNPNR